MLKKTFLLIIVLLLAYAPEVSARSKKDSNTNYKGYRFKVTLHNTQDSMLLLGYYMLGNTLVLDTAYIDKHGTFLFQNKSKTLKPGLYFFADKRGNMAEFAVYHERLDFEFEAQDDDWNGTMTVKGSRENELMCAFHRQSTAITRDIEQARQRMDSTQWAEYRMQRRGDIDQLKLSIIDQHPESMLAIITNATRPVVPPVVDENGDSLSNYQRYEYYVSHYWDYHPLRNDMLVRTPKPIFKESLTNFLDKTLNGLTPQMIIPYIDTLIDRSIGSEDNFHFLLHNITDYYLQSKVMVYDEVYVHLVKRYWEPGMVTWLSPSVIEEQIDRANKWDKILVGRKAPELIMKDTLGAFHSLHYLGGDYKLLLFWSPTCGHCKTMIPQFHEAWQRLVSDNRISVFAVLTEPDENSVKLWKRFLNEHGLDGWFHLNGGEANVDWRKVYDVETTPQTFLLDAENNIIAKKFDPELFESIIKQLQ